MPQTDTQQAGRSPFECQRCSQCCHGQGGIYYQASEIKDAAQELGLSSDDFISAYCRADGERYEVLTNDESNCRLLGPDGCMVHEVKPEICARWPFFENILERESAFEEAKLICPGLDPMATIEEFRALHKKLTGG